MEVNNIIDYNSLTPQQQIGRAVQANNEWSAQQAAKQMEFQREMSDTAHQREVADLKAAGLNPVLSAKLGGASTPSGAMGTTDTSGTSALVDLLTLSMETANSAAHAAAGISQGNGNSANGTSIFGLRPRDFMYKNPRTPQQMAWNAMLESIDDLNIQFDFPQLFALAKKVGVSISDFVGKDNSAKGVFKPIISGVNTPRNNVYGVSKGKLWEMIQADKAAGSGHSHTSGSFGNHTSGKF